MSGERRDHDEKEIWLEIISSGSAGGPSGCGLQQEQQASRWFYGGRREDPGGSRYQAGGINDFEGWKARFADSLQSSITEDVYQPYLDMLAKKGDFESFGKTAFVGQEKDGQKYAAVIYVVKYAEGEIKYTVGYDENMKLVQFVAQ